MPTGIQWPFNELIHCYCSISGAPGEQRHVLATPFDAFNLREPQLILLLNFFLCASGFAAICLIELRDL